MENDQFYQFVKNNAFLNGYKPKKEKSMKQITQVSQEEFLNSLNQNVQHFQIPKKSLTMPLMDETRSSSDNFREEFNEAQIQSQFQKTDREVEIKQQKRIIQLYQRIYNLNNDNKEMRRSNNELQIESQLQESQIKSHKYVKTSFEDNKVQWEKRIFNLQGNIKENDLLIRQLKLIMQVSLEELDREALSIAKKSIEQSKLVQIQQSDVSPKTNQKIKDRKSSAFIKKQFNSKQNK